MYTDKMFIESETNLGGWVSDAIITGKKDNYVLASLFENGQICLVDINIVSSPIIISCV